MHIYEEPILKIVSVVEAQSGQSIQSVCIHDIYIDGTMAHGEYLTAESEGVTLQDSLLLCDVPCSFGTEAGDYRFLIFAAGYKEVQVIVENVAYSVFRGGCPSYNSGSTEVSIELFPE